MRQKPPGRQRTVPPRCGNSSKGIDLVIGPEGLRHVGEEGAAALPDKGDGDGHPATGLGEGVGAVALGGDLYLPAVAVGDGDLVHLVAAVGVHGDGDLVVLLGGPGIDLDAAAVRHVQDGRVAGVDLGRRHDGVHAGFRKGGVSALADDLDIEPVRGAGEGARPDAEGAGGEAGAQVYAVDLGDALHHAGPQHLRGAAGRQLLRMLKKEAHFAVELFPLPGQDPSLHRFYTQEFPLFALTKVTPPNGANFR